MKEKQSHVQNVKEALEQEIPRFVTSLRQSIEVGEELAGFLEKAKEVEAQLRNALEQARAFHREWEEKKAELLDFAIQLKEEVQGQLKEGQQRLNDIQLITFKRLDSSEEQLKTYVKQTDELRKSLDKLADLARERHLEVARELRRLQGQIRFLWVALGLLALFAYLWKG